MIVPAGDPWYWQERSRIALPEEQLVSLDGMFALHPRLAPLKPLWDQHSLAIVHAVGSPSTTRSHFDAQDYMESGTPDVKNTPDGWANRYCTHAAEHANTPFARSHSGRSSRARWRAAPLARDRRPAHLRHARRAGERRTEADARFRGAVSGRGDWPRRVIVGRELRGDQDAQGGESGRDATGQRRHTAGASWPRRCSRSPS